MRGESKTIARGRTTTFFMAGLLVRIPTLTPLDQEFVEHASNKNKI